MMDLPLDTVAGLATALGIGLLVGVEREQAKGAADQGTPAGVRTFTLVALAGALGALLGTVPFVLAALGVIAFTVAAYRQIAHTDPGLTTEVAMLVVFLLGALAMDRGALAAALGVLVAVALASKGVMHRFSRELLSEAELRDMLILAAAALIVLPLLPGEALDPWGAFRLDAIGRLVVLVMAIQAIGYVGFRLFGPRVGLALTGLTGGFVSSTATHASMGARAREDPQLRPACVSAALMSNVATVIQLAVVTAALSPALTAHLAVPMIAAGLAVAIAAAIASVRAFREPSPDSQELKGRAFSIRQALVFAAVVGAVLFASAWLNARYGSIGATVGAALSGFADAHAAAASAAQLNAAGNLDLDQAAFAVTAGFATNTVSKAIVSAVAGGPGFVLRVLPGLAAMVAAFVLAVWWL